MNFCVNLYYYQSHEADDERPLEVGFDLGHFATFRLFLYQTWPQPNTNIRPFGSNGLGQYGVGVADSHLICREVESGGLLFITPVVYKGSNEWEHFKLWAFYGLRMMGLGPVAYDDFDAWYYNQTTYHLDDLPMNCMEHTVDWIYTNLGPEVRTKTWWTLSDGAAAIMRQPNTIRTPNSEIWSADSGLDYGISWASCARNFLLKRSHLPKGKINVLFGGQVLYRNYGALPDMTIVYPTTEPILAGWTTGDVTFPQPGYNGAIFTPVSRPYS